MSGMGWKGRAVSWAVAVGFAGWAGARIFSVDKYRSVQTGTAPLLSFTPQVAKAAPWAALGLGLAGQRGPALTAGAAAATLGVLVGVRNLPRPDNCPCGPLLRVMTHNTYFGRTDIEVLTARVRHYGADLLFLQELTEDTLRRLKQSGLEEMLPYSQVNMRGGARGSGIFSRYPLSDGPAIGQTHMAQPTAVAQLPSGYQVELVCAHPVPPSMGKHGAVKWRSELDALPAPGERPRIIAGDFNATPDHAAFRAVLRRGYYDAALQTGNGLTPTWGIPGRRAALALDHVLVDKTSAVLDYSVHAAPNSDHRVVYAEIQLQERPAPAE